MIALNSRARRRGKVQGEYGREEFKGRRRRRILTTKEWYNPVSQMLYHMKKRGSVGNGRKGFANSGSIFHQHPGLFSIDWRGCTEGRRRPTPQTRCHPDNLSRFIRHAGKWWAYSIRRPQVKLKIIENKILEKEFIFFIKLKNQVTQIKIH